METHVKVLAVLFIVFSALGTLAALVIATVFGVAGVATAAGASGGDAAIALPIIGLAGTALSAFLLAVSLPGLVAGIGLLKYKPWARILAIVLSALNLINFPLGTILGVYGLYVLLSEEGAQLFKPTMPAAVA
jgi:hypothetical protein